MKLETIEKKININRMVTQKTAIVTLEEDVIIPDIKPDILKTISSSGNVCVSKREVKDGKIKFEGYTNINIIYMPDSESDNVRGINTKIDFNEVVECIEATSEMKVSENILIKYIECRILNGRKINLKVELEIDVTLTNNEEISLLSEIKNVKDLQTISKKTKIDSIVGNNFTKTYAKETVKIDQNDNLAEILRSDFNIINKDIKISYNKLLAKAEVFTKLIYLTEDNRIKSVEAQIPVMGFVEMPDISEEDSCDIAYNIEDIVIKPNSQEEHSVYVEIEMEIRCNALKETEIELIEDLYSPTQNLKYNSNELVAMSGRMLKKEKSEIKEKLQIPQIIGEKIYDIKLTTNITNYKILSNKINYEMEMIAEFIISTNNGTSVDIVTKNIQMVDSIEFEGIDEKSDISTNISVEMIDYTIENNEVNLNIKFDYEINQHRDVKINAIREVWIDEEENEINPYSMTIYFVKKGDTLWKIAKKYKSTIDEIARLNEIKDKNKLQIGQQLFIPKYVCIQN